MDKIRWGILGTGRIATEFAKGLSYLPEADLLAVGSRTQAKADAFADQFNIPHRHGSYEHLAGDPDVDVIYVSTPHTYHAASTLLALGRRKAVLCEKPFTINAIETARLIESAQTHKLFLMEAMWTRFLPAMVKVRELLSSGVIGDIQMVSADFGFRASFNPQSRLFDPVLGGGALLDVGVYTIAFASMIFGVPSRIVSMANIGQTGVDEQAAMILGYSQGQMAVLYTAIRTNTTHEGFIMGTQGRIRIHPPLFHPARLTLSVSGKDDVIIDTPFSGNGMNYEAAEVMRCMRAGLTESPIMPLAESLSIMTTMDQIRAQWGLKYPME